ncbi:MAG: replicative DNA helicase [Clostridia bacterium]|nr:replicative DNA helicase [Clostridia bacterium]
MDAFPSVPPQSIEAERSVLGALLQDGSAVTLATEMLNAEDFYTPAHKAIYEAIHYLAAAGTAVDLVTVDAELTRRGTLEGVGGTAYLIELIKDMPSTVNVQEHIGIILEKSTLRQLIRAASTITRNCYANQMELKDILSAAEKEIFDIVMRRTGAAQLIPIREVLYETYAKIEELSRLGGKVAGVTTGFSKLDKDLTGMHGGELLLMGARPSMGKTSIALNIAASAARKGYSVAIFSLEMPREQIAMRLLCSEARVNMQSVRSGTIRDKEWMKLAQTVNPLSNEKIFIDDTAGLTPMQMRSRARRIMVEKGLDLIVVDYLQLMGADGRSENRQQEVSEISRRLKSIALELKVPILACAQLSRANTQRTVKRPMLSDLRDSGSIEQDADVVMFLHRDAYYDSSSEETNSATLIIAKQRNGPLGDIKLNWLAEYTLFEDAYYGDAEG